MSLLHPAIEHRTELGHFQERRVWNSGCGHVALDCGQLGLRRIVGILQATDAPEDLGEIERLDGDAAGFKDALRVAHGIEGGGTRTDGADAQILEALHDAANGGEPLEVGLELGGAEAFSM